MKKYRVMFETFIHPAFFFHTCYIVEANSVEEAKEKGQEAFNSHPNNVKLQREIVEVQEIKEEQ
ncbi:hypothetical protein [Staphylococcus epidermidis]|uniref:hypothetical protein n=1 Tax=Staphylococcus epidermidis TaxID=1282 RepID=UPI0002432C78|nr:hypothetical protein [Staphylococcus epidermidis]APT17166.1 hypothetical protein BUM85_09810 [Staphylococcus epidermidis]EHM72919.1 hypothetical protein HMPREF9956_0311 [Staphylococcus epidermidis 14.1.R1.SE]